MSQNAGPDRVVFINLTRQCNVDCRRCYLTPTHRRDAARLPEALLARLFDSTFCREAASLTLIWEGGEASILGEAYLRRVTRLARDKLPRARQTMVTNLLHLPSWLISLAHDQFDGGFETTWALGAKAMLNGDETGFQRRFRANLTRACRAGLRVPVNVEMNPETLCAGPEALVRIVEETGAPYWEFDLSVDFEAFLARPMYTAEGYPLLPRTASYEALEAYVLSLATSFHDRLDNAGFRNGLLEQAASGATSLAFNVCQELNFVTLNPDGTVTTNPLFSDLPHTYLGNLHHMPLEVILDHPARYQRAQYERRRLRECYGCPHLSRCGGGPSHVPVRDGSAACAGLRGVRDYYTQTGGRHAPVH